jgi:Na+/melibiose symporter-like transporter
MALLNETGVSIYLYIMILLTDYLGDGKHRDQYGWALTMLILGIVTVNFFRALVKISRSILASIKKMKCTKEKSQNDDKVVSIKPAVE